MTRILAATDLSPRSERALRRAAQLAESLDAELTALSVVDADLPRDLAESMKEQVEAKLRALCAEISARPCEAVAVIDDPLTAIHAAADARNADLVTLGLHRVRPIADLFGGTTMERLVRASARPVLVVRDPVGGPYARPVCGLDLSPACAAAAKAAAALAPGARIATFHAVHVPFKGFAGFGGAEVAGKPFLDDARGRLEEWVAQADLPAACAPPELLAGSAPEALHEMVRKTEADLIVIGAHGRAALTPSHLGGFATDLLRHPPRDILIVRR